MQEHVFGCVYKRAPVGCLVRMTDAVVRYINPESVFYFTLRHTDDQKCDVILVSLQVQWGSEYRPFEYRKHLNTELFEVRISNGRSNAMSYVLDRPSKHWTST